MVLLRQYDEDRFSKGACNMFRTYNTEKLRIDLQS